MDCGGGCPFILYRLWWTVYLGEVSLSSLKVVTTMIVRVASTHGNGCYMEIVSGRARC